MNHQNPTSRRLVFRPMSLAIHSLSLATASSVFLWSLGGGFDAPLPPMASAATKAEKSEKDAKPEKPTGKKKAEPAPESVPSAIGSSPEAEIPAVKLNYMSTPWQKVLEDLATSTNSELVMNRVPKGRYSRRDSAKYNRHDAVRILNKDIEPLGFRLIEMGDFLVLLDLPSQKPRYAPAVLPARQEPPHVIQEADNSSPYERRVESMTHRAADAQTEVAVESPTKPSTARKNSVAPKAKPIKQVNHDETSDEGAPPEQLKDDSLEAPAQLVFRPRNRNVVDLSRQIYRTFKPRAQLISSGRNHLPAFRIATAAPSAEVADAKPAADESHVTMAIDEADNQLFIDGNAREANGIMKLLRTLDRPFDDSEPVQIATSSKYVCQIADQLPAEIERLRAARRDDPEARTTTVAQGDEPTRDDPSDPAMRRSLVPGMPPAIGDLLGNLKGEVNIEAIDDLGALILRGNKEDVEQVMQVIRELEKLSEATAPMTHLLYLRNVDAESLAELLTNVYDRLTKFPGRATQPRQSAAILPITKPNSLLIIAPKADLEAILDLAEELDRPVDPQTEFQVFRLKTAIAAQIEEQITTFYAERQNLGVKVLVIADSRANAVIVRAQPRDLDEIAALIKKLDRDDPAAVNSLKIFPLKNAIATELAAVMNSAIQSVIAPPTSGTGGGGNQFGGQTGINPAQIDEQFKNVKSAVLQIFSPNGSGDKIRSGILADIRITPDARVNSLVVSASEQSMSLIEELIKQLDRPTTTVSEIKVFTLANADAELMVTQLNALFNNQQQGQGGNQQRQNLGIALENAADSSSSLVPMKFSVDKRTNSVIAVGAREALGVVEAILLRLDESDLRARQNVVIRLQNSQASLIAQSIAQFYQSQRDIAQADPNLISSVEQMEKEVVVVPDTTNNSLLLSATPRYFKNIETMILKLDAQPRQVVIQALLVEVELTNTDEFGIELGFQDPILFNRSIKDQPVVNTTTTTAPNGTQTTSNTILSQSGQPGFNFNNPSLPLGNNLATAPAAVAAQGLTNFSLGRVNSDLGFGGLVLSAGSDAVNVLIRALSAHRKITVLSRPQIRALDNQMAEIFSGQNIPVVNGFTANGTTGVNTPTVVQRDAGVQLQVMPRITADGNVVMMLFAQRSQYRQQGVPLSTDATGKTVSSPILDISRLQTTISVPTGNTVVIGGLINTRDESFTNKAPFLAEIPLLGHLFRFDSRSTRRSELLVFLTPRILGGAIDEETIKEVEMGRIHFIESEAEELHGPLRALPCPEDIFNDPNASPMIGPGMSPMSPRMAPTDIPPVPPAAPATPSIPAPPAPDPSTSVIRDSSVNPVSARLRYTEADESKPTVEQAKGTTKVEPKPKNSLFGKRPTRKPAETP
jgi:general secretion pathway protein D